LSNKFEGINVNEGQTRAKSEKDPKLETISKLLLIDLNQKLSRQIHQHTLNEMLVTCASYV